MSRPLRFVVRGLAAVALLSCLSLLSSLSSPTSGPYSSALTISEAMAAPSPGCHTICHCPRGKPCKCESVIYNDTCVVDSGTLCHTVFSC